MSLLVRHELRSDGSLVVHGPTECPAGHPLGPNRVLVGYVPCSCTDSVLRHQTWTCRTCGRQAFDPPCSNPASRFNGAYPERGF